MDNIFKTLHIVIISLIVSITTIFIYENLLEHSRGEYERDKLTSNIENAEEARGDTEEEGEEGEKAGGIIEYDSQRSKEVRLMQEIDIAEDSVTLKLGKEFNEALYGKYNILTFPSIETVSSVETLVDESGKTASSSYAYLDVSPVSSNYIAYTYESEKSLIDATKFSLSSNGRDLIQNYEEDILKDSKKLSDSINIQDCYLGYPIYLPSSDGQYRFSNAILAAYESGEEYNIGVLGFITDNGYTPIEESSFKEFNSTNKLMSNGYTNMKEWRLSFESDDNLIYLEDMGKYTGENVLYTDITYPLCGSTSENLE